MKLHLRFILFAISMLLVLGGLTGCGGSSNGSSDDETLQTDEENTGTGVLIINEIVAKSEDGTNDWIELYATQDTVSVGEYTIVDDDPNHELQALPDITLNPGEFLIIEAIDSEDECPQDSYCVAFKLGSDDSVTLYQEGVIQNSLDWDEGQAEEGYSYGLLPDGTGSAQILTPTAGSANQAAEDDGSDGTDDDTDTELDANPTLMINEIVAKAADDGDDWIEFYASGDQTVLLSEYSVVDDNEDHLAAALPDVILSPGEFYVVLATDEAPADGSDYVAFKLGSNDSVSLFQGDDLIDKLEWDDSDAPQGFSYGLYPDGVRNAQTMQPTIGSANEALTFFATDTVESIYIDLSDSDWQDILANPLDEAYHTATVTYQGVALESVAFRTKGNSSLMSVANMNSERYSFKVDMNYYVDGQKLLNMKKINLNNNFKDPSYMRERLAYDLMRYLSIPAPRQSYVNLYINGALHGLYSLVEQVDSEFLEAHFDDPDGDLYKPDGVGSDLLWWGNDFSAYTGVELKTNEESSDNGAFIAMVDELNNGSDLEAVLDTDMALRYLAVSTALSNMDSYQGPLAHNYYIYEQDNVFTVIPWDLNEAFGTFRMGCQDADSMISLYIDEPTTGAVEERPLISMLMAGNAYRESYHDYLQALIDGPLDPDTISVSIQEIKALIQEHVASDVTAFYTYAQFEASLGTQTIGDIFGLQDFVDRRTANIQDQLDGVAASQGDGSGNCSGAGFPVGPPVAQP